jgi:putative membrane protein
VLKSKELNKGRLAATPGLYEKEVDMWDWELWWSFPLIMIIICFFVMRGGFSMCRHGSHDEGGSSSDLAKEILDRRYAGGEIDKSEYEEKKRDLNRSN